MEKTYCRTCLLFEPDKDAPDYGICKLTERETNEGRGEDCPDWRYYMIPIKL